MDDQTVEWALKAYENGYRIIAGWFNAAFDARKIGVRIKADPPPPGVVTLGECQLRLSNLLIAFRPFCPSLPFDDKLCPWIVGYLLGELDQAGDKVSGIALRGDSWLASAEAVQNIVGVKHSYGWKDAGPWRANVIEPMEEQAQSWREWLRTYRTATNDDEPNRYEALPKLPASHRKAYMSFLYAEAKTERKLQDKDAYDLLKEDGIDVEKTNELHDYMLPPFDTWSRYLRRARNATSEQKNTPRSGRKLSG